MAISANPFWSRISGYRLLTSQTSAKREIRDGEILLWLAVVGEKIMVVSVLLAWWKVEKGEFGMGNFLLLLQRLANSLGLRDSRLSGVFWTGFISVLIQLGNRLIRDQRRFW